MHNYTRVRRLTVTAHWRQIVSSKYGDGDVAYHVRHSDIGESCLARQGCSTSAVLELNVPRPLLTMNTRRTYNRDKNNNNVKCAAMIELRSVNEWQCAVCL